MALETGQDDADIAQGFRSARPEGQGPAVVFQAGVPLAALLSAPAQAKKRFEIAGIDAECLPSPFLCLG